MITTFYASQKTLKMLSRPIFLFICAVCAITNSAHIQPLDLIDEALEQVEQLKSIVQGEIFSAHNNLNDITFAFETNSANVGDSGVVAVEQEQEKVVAQLVSIKDLANLEGKNASLCYEKSEEVLNNLPVRFIKEMSVCIAQLENEAKRLSESSKYNVDILFNVVNHLEFQIRQCKGELLCISPLLNAIELKKIKLPQDIKSEVQACDSILTVLQLYTQACSKNKVSQYVIEAFTVLTDIQSCINKLPVF